MFNNRREKEEEETKSSNFIGKGTIIEGTITSAGSMRIEGKIIGSIQSKSKIVLGESCELRGEMTAVSAEIEGDVTGNITLKDILILKSTAKLVGDITIKKLVIENGASFNGACKMGELKNQEAQTKVLSPSVDAKK
ncbi:MAG: polymer-forming cytoskeletal protein [Chitinophagaceae bacterium]|nr:polymer-forming cytoskeletal protein [Chitinophagaceae bacterium]